MWSDDTETKCDTEVVPAVIIRAALACFVARCREESLDVVRAAVAALPDGHLMEEDVDLLLGDAWEDR